VQIRVLLATLTLGSLATEVSGNWWAWLIPALAVAERFPGRSRTDTERAAQQARLLRFTTPVAWVLAPVVMIVALGLFREAYLKFLLIASPARPYSLREL